MSAARDADAVATALALLEKGDASIVSFNMNDADIERRFEHPLAAIGLGQQRRRIEKRHVHGSGADVMRQHRRPGGEAERRHPGPIAAGADADPHVTVTAIGNVRVSSDIEGHLPERFGAYEIGPSRKRLKAGITEGNGTVGMIRQFSSLRMIGR